jgi:Family of unknown function (DUF6152)/Haemolysin-type calcium binding protein related domain
MKRTLIIAILSALAVTEPAVAHHSFAVHFDPDKHISVTGVVTEFRFANPHGVIYFDVKADDGTVQKWRAETNSPTLLRRRGWSADSVAPGDKITIVGWPSRDGSALMRIDKVVFSDGSELTSQGLNGKPAD